MTNRRESLLGDSRRSEDVSVTFERVLGTFHDKPSGVFASGLKNVRTHISHFERVLRTVRDEPSRVFACELKKARKHPSHFERVLRTVHEEASRVFA